jgi:hypothetical protein
MNMHRLRLACAVTSHSFPHHKRSCVVEDKNANTYSHLFPHACLRGGHYALSVIYRLILCVINGMLAVGTSALELYGVRLVSSDLARCQPQTIF